MRVDITYPGSPAVTYLDITYPGSPAVTVTAQAVAYAGTGPTGAPGATGPAGADGADGAGVQDRLAGFDYLNDFLNVPPDGLLLLTNSGTGAGSTMQTSPANNRPGILRASTGTTATGRTSAFTGATAIALGGGAIAYECDVNVTTLSTSTERFQLVIGLFDTNTAANQVDGCYFLYDEGGVSTGSTAAAYWQTVTASNSSRTFNTSLTQTTVSAGSWVRLRIEVNAAGTSVAFYINGTLVATHTATIPAGTSRVLGFGYLLIKSVGTTARTVDFDYVDVHQTFTTAR